VSNPHDPAGLVKEAIDGHATALGELFEAWADGDDVDLVKTAQQCVDRAVTTATRFVLFWDNIATMMAETGQAPLHFPPPPVGGPGCTTPLRLAGVALGDITVTQGLRRRGAPSTDIVVPANAIAASTDGADVVLTIDCNGVARGLYELVVNVAGAPATHNVYVDPS
jgi:hypothetical protein